MSYAYTPSNINLIRKAGVGVIAVKLCPDFFLFFSRDQEHLWHVELFIFILPRDLRSLDRRNLVLLFFFLLRSFLWNTDNCDEDSLTSVAHIISNKKLLRNVVLQDTNKIRQGGCATKDMVSYLNCNLNRQLWRSYEFLSKYHLKTISRPIFCFNS